MKWWQTICAVILFFVFLAVQQSTNEQLKHAFRSVMYNSYDVFLLKSFVQQQLAEDDRQLVPTVGRQDSTTTIKAYGEGFIVHTASSNFYANNNSFVLFTGFMKNTGRTMTLQYGNDFTVTYGLVEQFLQLPYRFVASREPLFYNEQTLYLKIEQDGQALNEQQTLAIFQALHQ